MSERKNPPLLSAIWADIGEWVRVKGRATTASHGQINAFGPGPRSLLDVLGLPGFWAVTLWRVANALHDAGLRPMSRLAYFANMVLFSADLAPGAVVGPGMVMPHPVGVACASDAVLGARCRLMGLVRLGGAGRADRLGHPVIGDDVWIMDGAKVFGPVAVGHRSIIGTNALVTKDVPAETVAVVAAPGGLQLRPRDTASEVSQVLR